MFNTKKILELEYTVKLLTQEHTALIDKYNALADTHNALQDQVANLPEYQLGFLKHQERD